MSDDELSDAELELDQYILTWRVARTSSKVVVFGKTHSVRGLNFWDRRQWHRLGGGRIQFWQSSTPR
eukprot:COSAG01_NODE_28776_length_653_cov_0.767148_1_plen_66_part_10